MAQEAVTIIYCAGMYRCNWAVSTTEEKDMKEKLIDKVIGKFYVYSKYSKWRQPTVMLVRAVLPDSVDGAIGV